MTTYIHKETGDQVDLEKWRWEAHYLDGTVIKQFDKLDDQRGEFHRFNEIDQSRLHVFKMVGDEAGLHFTLLFDPSSMKLIHFYKSGIKTVERVNEDGTSVIVGEPLTSKGYVFGYEKNGQKSLLFLAPSGEVVLTDDSDKIALTIQTQEI